MCVCIYIYIINIHTYVCVCMRVCVLARASLCRCSCVSVCPSVCLPAWMHVRVIMSASSYVRICGVCMSPYLCKHAYVFLLGFVCEPLCAYAAYACIYAWVYVSVYVCVCRFRIHTHTGICIYIYMDTHRHVCISWSCIFLPYLCVRAHIHTCRCLC